MAGAVFSRGRSPVASALNHGASHIFTTALPATRPPLHSANPYIQKQLPASLAKAGITTRPGQDAPGVLLLLGYPVGMEGKEREGKEECLGRWQCSNETCKCQQCFLAFLKQENGPADTLWSLAKHVGGHVVNLLVAAVAKKLSSHVGTVAGGRAREREREKSTCRNKASHSTNSAVCMQRKRYFCKQGLRNKIFPLLSARQLVTSTW